MISARPPNVFAFWYLFWILGATHYVACRRMTKIEDFQSLSQVLCQPADQGLELKPEYSITIGGLGAKRPKFTVGRGQDDIQDDAHQTRLAGAVWEDKMNSTGWNFLRIDINEAANVSDGCKSYAAGLLEGCLTHHRIRDFFLNTRGLIMAQNGGSVAINRVRNVVRESVNRIQSISNWDANKPFDSPRLLDPVNELVRLSLLQIWGISDGYNAARKIFHSQEPLADWPEIDLIDMHFLSADGDIPDIKDALIPEARESLPLESPVPRTNIDRSSKSSIMMPMSELSQDQARQSFGLPRFTTVQRHQPDSISNDKNLYIGNRRRHGRCSALVRLAANNSELFAGHSTWEPFSEMTRILKFYNFPFEGVASKFLAFSSYPGAITSTDDFIITSSDLVLMETTIDIRNRSLFRKRSNIKSNKGNFFDFLKPLVAARLAKSGKEWVDIFSSKASSFLGISSCQWMVIDYAKFNKEHKMLAETGVLHIVEGIPGQVVYRDMSSYLQSERYWGSSNRAWFKSIRESIEEKEVDNDAALLSAFAGEDNNPRAFTFAELAPHIDSIDDMQRLMQFSAVPHAKSGPPSSLSIAPRFDLSGEKGTPEGATDSKITDSSLLRNLSFIGISGPEHHQHRPFSWTNEKKHDKYDSKIWPHHGMPELWNFTWQLISPTGMKPLSIVTMDQHGRLQEWNEQLRENYYPTNIEKEYQEEYE